MWLCALSLMHALPAPGTDEILAALIRGHCIECHSSPRPKGDLDLAAWIDGSTALSGDASLDDSLERVRERLLLGEMPPPTRAQSSSAAKLD